MSIPQICPNCGNHISTPHEKDCAFGTPEYAHLGWPNAVNQATSDAMLYGVGAYKISMQETPCHDHSYLTGSLRDPDTASAIRRLLDYLNDEPEEADKDQLAPQELSFKSRMLCRLSAKANELRKEAAGMYNIDARAKRNFSADILESLIEEFNAE